MTIIVTVTNPGKISLQENIIKLIIRYLSTVVIKTGLLNLNKGKKTDKK